MKWELWESFFGGATVGFFLCALMTLLIFKEQIEASQGSDMFLFFVIFFVAIIVAISVSEIKRMLEKEKR
jgi:hypothetical protein